MDKFGSKFTEIMEANLEALGIRPKLLENVKKAIGTCLIKGSLEANKPNLVIMYEPETEM